MIPTFRQLVKQFAEGAVKAREELAKKLLASGYTPDKVVIAERTWYDDETYELKYKCWPILRNASNNNWRNNN